MSEAIFEWFEDVIDYNIYENSALTKTWKEDLLQKTPISDLMWSNITMLLFFIGMPTLLIWKYWSSLQRVYASTRESIECGFDKLDSIVTAVQTCVDPLWPWLHPLVHFLHRSLHALFEYIRCKTVTLLGGEIHTAPPETAFDDTSAQDSNLRAELIAAKAANVRLHDELTAANAANASLRDELATASKPVEDVPQLPQLPHYEPRLSLGGYKARSVFKRASPHPGICVPTPLSVVKAGIHASNQISCTTTMDEGTQTLSARAPEQTDSAICSFSPLMSVAIKPQPQQLMNNTISPALSLSALTAVQIQPQSQAERPVSTNNATSAFSSIRAVHTAEPIYQRPITRITDAGTQADSTASSTDTVSREELNAQAERYAIKEAALTCAHSLAVTALNQSNKEALESQQERHEADINAVKTLQASDEQAALKAQEERHGLDIAAFRSSHSSEIAALKLATQAELNAQKERHESEITSAVEASTGVQLAAQKGDHDLEIEMLKTYHASELDPLKAQQERYIEDITILRSSYASEITAFKTTQDHLQAQAERHESQIAVVEASARDESAAQQQTLDNDMQNLKNTNKAEFDEEVEKKVTEEMDAYRRRCSDEFVSIQNKHTGDLNAREIAHQGNIDSIRAHHASEITILDQRHARELSAFSKNSSELSEYKKSHTSLQENLNRLTNDNNTKEATIKSLNAQKDDLTGKLQAATIAVASGVDPQAAAEQLQKLHKGYKEQLKGKDNDLKRANENREKQVNFVMTQLRQAEEKAKSSGEWAQKYSQLKLQTGPSRGGAPVNGVGRNSANLQQQLDVVKKERDDLKVQKEASEGALTACKAQLAEAVKSAADWETACRKTGRGKGAEAVAELAKKPAVNAVVGRKRGAEQEMSGEHEKRARE